MSGLGPMLTSARSLREYRAMFALGDVGDLRGRRVLDCPGGAASFTAAATAAGVDVTAVDPSYAGGPDALWALAAHALTEVERGHAFIEEHAGRFAWTTFPDAATYLAERSAAARAFGDDAAAHPERYVAAALPNLPFPDSSFDLVLCSHLLFSYDDRLDVGWHVAALVELVRVARGEVRVFPLLSHVDGDLSPLLAPVRAALAGRGITSRVVDVGYELQRGGTQMLVAAEPPKTGGRLGEALSGGAAEGSGASSRTSGETG